MNTQELLDKAERALASSKLLLEDNDVDGACNRAYYAMFDAARAALVAVMRQCRLKMCVPMAACSAFSLYLVKPGRIPIEYGRALNRAEEISLDCRLPRRSGGIGTGRLGGRTSWAFCAIDPVGIHIHIAQLLTI